MIVRVVMILFAACLCAFSSVAQQGAAVIQAPPPDSPNTLTAPAPDTSSYLIRTISIKGNKITKDAIVFREVAVKSGEMLTEHNLNKKLQLTKEQLMNTTLFVNVVINKNVDPFGIVDLEIVLAERWYIFPIPYFKVVDRNWNVWINDYKASLDRTLLGVKITHNNTTGRNDKLNVWVIGGYTQQLEFKYQLPYADKKMEKGFTVGMSYGRNREINYATDSNKQKFKSIDNFGRKYFRSELTFSYRKGSKQRIYLKTVFGQEKIDSAFYKLNPNYLAGHTQASFVDVTATYQYYNVDYIPFPLRGWYVDAYAMQRISNTIGMTSFGGKALGTWEFMPKTYINFQGVFAYMPRQNQPYFNTRLMGYGNLWLQGLEYYVMDGTFGAVGRTTFRRKLFTYTFHGPSKWKTYSKIPFRFFMKAYGNIGYAYHNNPGNNYMNNQLLRTAGMGFEVATIYDLVMKFDYSFNQFGEHGFFIHTAADF
ncbi:MAG TPA: POTRA domain-containing protein [Phnomibacter sp.]|nr:POTRA domain-containing protein [Phnomibacter sp.]